MAWISMPELEDVLGRDMARTLARCRGGLDTYVPKRSDVGHTLAKIVGPRGMEALCRAYPGEYITVPNGRHEPQKARVLKLLKQGFSKKEAALACGVTERYVYMLASLACDGRQLTLF